jgi:DNA-binding transcriptional MerR regulator
MASSVEIPKRSLFKAAEVCLIAGVQPYVLRSWEAEFSSLGISRTNAGPRVYRRADVARVIAIKNLVFVEGLTLGAARRRIESENAPEPSDDGTEIEKLLGENARDRIADVTRGLRDILTLLSGNGQGSSEAFKTTVVNKGERSRKAKRSAAEKRPSARAAAMLKKKRRESNSLTIVRSE